MSARAVFWAGVCHEASRRGRRALVSAWTRPGATAEALQACGDLRRKARAIRSTVAGPVGSAEWRARASQSALMAARAQVYQARKAREAGVTGCRLPK